MREDEIAHLLHRAWFRAYVYAEEELTIAGSYGPSRAQEFLAGRFAAKEATLKAIRAGAGAGIPPRQIAILRTAEGAPVVRLTGKAAQRVKDLGIAKVIVSITHKQGLVVAAAVAVAEYASNDHGSDIPLSCGIKTVRPDARVVESEHGLGYS